MKRLLLITATLALVLSCGKKDNFTSLVRPMMGTAATGNCIPVAARPFGLVELGPDNIRTSSGYNSTLDFVYGFAHCHKNGGGGCDLQDIKFMPITDSLWGSSVQTYPDIRSHVSHEREHAEPGYYSVDLLDYGIKAELTATARTGLHRYTFPEGTKQYLSVDLEFGCEHSCTIWPDEDYDTVKVASIKVIGDYDISGRRISNGWCPEQHVYFHARFNKPISDYRIFDHMNLAEGVSELTSTDVRMLLSFDEGHSGEPLVAWVGISPVSEEGALANLEAESAGKPFDKIRKEAGDEWEKELSVIKINDPESEQKRVFYTSLYYSLLYPQIFSDVDGHYRSSDRKVYSGSRPYYAGVLGLWDTFRAQNPLITLLHPEVMSDLIQTLKVHYDHCGQLPIWTLYGQENMCMIGYHSMPVIADAYAKGIRGFDPEELFEAMKTSANRDEFGYFLKDFRGSRNYLKYGYVPCDKEITAVSKTLEYAYDDWCIARMALMLSHRDDYESFLSRSLSYQTLFDASSGFMRGKDSQGRWRIPFDPHFSNHYREGDDFCEGTAWQWTFFVPHDGQGLIDMFGSRERFIEKLDSLFEASSELHGEHVAGDITGLIGQYAHGNEPSHHTLYMYNYAGQPWKTQKRASEVMYNLYDTSPTGICGNEDTGQMSAWFVFSAMGFYPVTHGDGRYFIGTPLFKDLSFKHSKGTLHILAPDASEHNCYIQSLKMNGKTYTHAWFDHDVLFGGDVTLEYEMGPEPQTQWGSAPEDIPWSLEEDRLVGISCGLTDGGSSLVHDTYPEAVRAAGFTPLLIPTVSSEEEARKVISRIDAVVFSGGADLDPSYYGEKTIPEASVQVDSTRDRSEILLAREALRRGIPILGICRGAQLMNVVLGGSLYQDIPLQKGTKVNHAQSAPSSEPTHEITIQEGSLLHKLYGTQTLRVNSTHHQAVKRPAPGIKITAVADDGIPEAFESLDGQVVAVQFHPEKLIEGGDISWISLFRESLLNHRKGND